MLKKFLGLCASLFIVGAFLIVPAQSSEASPSIPWGSGTGIISGTVTSLSSGLPVSGASVTLKGNNSGYYSHNAMATTDSSGNYSFSGLITAKYKIHVVPPSNSGLAAQWLTGQASMTNAQEINLSDGQTLSGTDLSLVAESKITGQVTAVTGGGAISGVTVTAQIVTDYSSSYDATTDSSGNYQITNLPAGSYVLKFRAPNANYVEEWWGNAFTYIDATPLAVTAQQTVSNINVALDTGAVLSGRVISEADNTPLANVSIQMRTADYRFNYFGYTDSNGNYSIQGIRAGSYTVYYSASYNSGYVSEYWNEAATFDQATLLNLAGGQALSGTNVSLTLGGIVQGRVVQSESTSTNIQSVSVSVIDPVTFEYAGGASTAADGTYSIVGVRPGTYTVVFDGNYLTPTRQRITLGNVAGFPGASTFTIHSGETLGNKNAQLPLANSTYRAPGPVGVISNPTGTQEVVNWTQPTSAEAIMGYESGGMITQIGGSAGGGGASYGSDPNLVMGDGVFFGSGPNSELRTYKPFTSSAQGQMTAVVLNNTQGGSLEPAPTISVTNVTNTSFTVSWTPGSSVSMLNWNVSLYGISSNEGQFSNIDQSGLLSKTFTGLTSGRAYEIFISGFSTTAASVWGRSGVVWTTGNALSLTPVPTIAGNSSPGSTLSSSPGTWDSGVVLTYQWQRNGVDIPGANGTSYTLQNVDNSTNIRLQVTGSKDGFSHSVQSSSSVAVSVGNSTPTPSPTPSSSSSPSSSPSNSSSQRPRPSFNSGRLSGGDRYTTSVEISRPFTSGVPVVYVATGENYPDALSAGSAAASANGPLLLVDPNYLPGSIRNEIQRLQPQQIVVVGGTAAVSANVYNELSQLAPNIRRDAGSDRFSTSRLIAQRAFSSSGATTAFIATGHDFPDALAASAAAASLGAPVILVDGKASVADGGSIYLLRQLGVTRIYIAGGTGVVSTGIESSLKAEFGFNNVTRLAGQDRYSTSRTINATIFNSASKTFLAVGTNFPDSLSGAALAGVMGSPLYIVPQNCVPSDVSYDIRRFGSTPVLLGGSGVLSDSVGRLDPC